MFLPGISRKILGMSYNAKNSESSFSRSDSSITLRVPYIQQKHVNLCSDATAAMIVQAWGFKTTNNTSKNNRGAFKGACIEDHTNIAEAGACYWRSMPPPKDLTSAAIVDYLFEYGPLGLSYNSKLGGHCVCIIGAYANNNQVIVHDPWTGPYKTLNFPELKNKIQDFTWLEKVGQKKMVDSSTPWMS